MDKIRFSEDHPVWNIIRLAVVFIGVTVLMYLNGDKFDNGEITTILELSGLVAGFEFTRTRLMKKKPNDP